MSGILLAKRHAVPRRKSGLLVASCLNNTILTSRDGGINWDSHSAGLSAGQHANGIAWSPTLKRLVAATDAGLSYSDDADTWTTSLTTSQSTYRVIWSARLGMFISADVQSGTGTGYARWSTDGAAWTSGQLSTSDVWTYAWALADSTTTAVVVGQDDRKSYSGSGTSWSRLPPTSGGPSWRGICWSDSLGLFIMVGTGGNIRTSPASGTAWTARTSGTGNYLLGVAWSPTLAVAVAAGQNGALVTSPDGSSWTGRTSNVSHDMRNIVWIDELGKFILMGDGGYTSHSTNATTWTPYAVPATPTGMTYAPTL